MIGVRFVFETIINYLPTCFDNMPLPDSSHAL